MTQRQGVQYPVELHGAYTDNRFKWKLLSADSVASSKLDHYCDCALMLSRKF